MNNQKVNIGQQEDELAKRLEPLIQQMKSLYDRAVEIYKPLVDNLCSRKATQREVEHMLDWLLMYAGERRMLALYKQVCRSYWKMYPDSVAYYIMEYRKEYDPDSLIGTEYENLLHKDMVAPF